MGANQRMVLSIFLIFLVSAIPPASAEAPGPTFPQAVQTLYLTGDTGNAGPIPDVLLMREDGPSGGDTTQGIQVPLLEGLGLSDDRISWYYDQPFTEDRIIANTVDITLYFSLQVEAVTEATVRLYNIETDGEVHLLGQETHLISVTSTLPISEEFALAAAGSILQKDSILRLEVQMNGLAVINNLQYGTDTAPSAIDHFPTRILDSDHDGLSDSFERDSLGTDPFHDDTDGDGFYDGEEVLAGTDPNDRSDHPGETVDDRDGDGLSDSSEALLGTDPDSADTDGDGYSDGLEFHYGSDPRDPDSVPTDRDGDGLPDEYEALVGSDPNNPDSDGDGIPDADEDSDGDGLSDGDEASHGTDATDPDTDGDGIPDGKEVADGTNPRTDPDRDQGLDLTEPVAGTAVALAGAGIIVYALVGRYGL